MKAKVMIQINKFNTWGCTLILLICASCGSSKHLPDIPKSNLPESFSYDTSTSLVDSTETVANLSYKEYFNDQHLVSLIESGLQKNNNMQVAIKQIEIANETMKQAKWGYLPIINLSAASSSITRSSDNSLNGIMASQFTGKPYIEDYSSMINMSWEADIWGKIKNQKAGALARYLESIEAVKAVRTNLVARIAQGYYNLLMLDEQKLVSTHNQAIVDSTLVMVKVQNRLGISNSLAVKQLENSRDNLSKYIRQIDENVTTQEYALKALVGDFPKRSTTRSRLTDLNERNSFATGVPISLLELRPDIKQAEYIFRRSVSDFKFARANMYPSLRITAQGGLNAFRASDWFSIPGSLFGIVAGSLTQPLLQGRQLKTAYNQATIRSEQAELQYKESVLQAVTEVSTILEQIASLRDRQTFTGQQVARNQELIQQTNIMFRNDMATYLEVLAAQQSKLSAEIEQMQIKGQLLYAEVALYKALGGGVN
jgi:multidrug efflux system outer membrane protein